MEDYGEWIKDESRSSQCRYCKENSVFWWFRHDERDHVHVKKWACDACWRQSREIEIYDEHEHFECPQCKSSVLDWQDGDTDYHDCPILKKRTDHSYDRVKCEDCGHCFYIVRYACGCPSEYQELQRWDECK